MSNPSSGSQVNHRERARIQLQNRDLLLAEQSYRRLLETEPADAEALQYLARTCTERGQPEQAIELLLTAHQTCPDEPGILQQLGTMQLASGQASAAVNSLRRCLEIAPDTFVARLRLGVALEQLGQSHDATLAYFNAINVAQAHGRWLSEASTAPLLREAVKHAMNYVDQGRRQLFDEVLEPLRQRYGRDELQRVDQCLAIYLNERPANLPDPRQQPKFLYFPGLPPQPFYARERFPWQSELEAAGAAIRGELREVIGHGDHLESFLQSGLPEETEGYLRASGNGPAAWDAYFFFRHGQRHAENCAHCPQTVAVLDLPRWCRFAITHQKHCSPCCVRAHTFCRTAASPTPGW